MAQLVQRGDPFRRRRTAGHRQDADRFDVTDRGSSGRPNALPDSAARAARDGVDRVGLALTVTDLPVRAIDLDHRDAGTVQLAGQPGPIGAGALHADQLDDAVRAQPADQPLIAGLGRLERLDAEHTAEVIDYRGDVHINMGVHTRSHATWGLYDGHGHPFLPTGSRGGTHLPGGCREPGLLAQARNHSPPDR